MISALMLLLLVWSEVIAERHPAFYGLLWMMGGELFLELVMFATGAFR